MSLTKKKLKLCAGHFGFNCMNYDDLHTRPSMERMDNCASAQRSDQPQARPARATMELSYPICGRQVGLSRTEVFEKNMSETEAQANTGFLADGLSNVYIVAIKYPVCWKMNQSSIRSVNQSNIRSVNQVSGLSEDESMFHPNRCVTN